MAHETATPASRPERGYQQGDGCDLVDQAVDFVLSKINLAVGTREHSTQAPVAYAIRRRWFSSRSSTPCPSRRHQHRQRAGHAFADRLEVWNPGTLPPPLTLEMLRQPHGSVPGNPLLAKPLYLTSTSSAWGPARAT